MCLFKAVTTASRIKIALLCLAVVFKIGNKAFLPLKGQAMIKLNRPQTIYQRFQCTFEIELNHIA